MEFNPSPIGSLLTANEGQFVSLYRYRTQNDQNNFVEDYKSLQENAVKEVEKLKELNTTPKLVEEKLFKIIEKTKNVYESSIENKIKLSFTENGRPFIDVNEEGVFRVFGFDSFAKSGFSCHICYQGIPGSIFQIENLQTHEKIIISDLELHNIKSHEYFSGYSIKICKALDFVK